MRRFTIYLFAACCFGQTPVAPTPETVGPVRGDFWHDYNIVNSIEAGDRVVSISGNAAKYRSDENYGNGIRLFNALFSMDSKDGHGFLFDKLVFTTSGVGDPYTSANLRVERNRLYEYNFFWRKNEYVNPGLTTAGQTGQHLLDTSHKMQDHELTLFPQSRLRFTLGYSRDAQSGAGISTVQLFQLSSPFDSTGDIFPIFSNIKRVQNDYRLGGELHIFGFLFTAMHGWEDYKDDTPYSTFSGLNLFNRTAPNHGTSPYWRAGLFRNDRWWDVNARFTYTGGTRRFLTNELAIGQDRFGALANQQILSFGDARRPVATGNANLTLQPLPKLTIASRTSFYNVRTEGNSTYLQFNNSTQSADFLYFQFLGIRTVETDLDVLYQLSPRFDLHGGYAFSDRRISSSPQFAFSGSTSPTPFEQTNQLHTGSFGFRWRPLQPLTISVDAEVGRADHPFTPKSDRNYTAFAGRIEYKLKTLRLLAWTNTAYNANSVTLSSFSSHARTYSGSASWNPRSWFGLDASYSKLHLDTLGGIAFFANAQFLPDQLSYYVSNLHTATFSARFSYKRADLFAGFSRVQDTGDGRSAPANTSIGPAIPAFQTAQTFPLRFQSPTGRLSIRINERLRWNVGYQYYGYHEDFFSGENYIANTGYTSLLWSF
jgi:hypothetical protein